MSIFFIATIVSLVILGLIFFLRNKIQWNRALASGEEFIFSTDISWSKSLKHSLVMYFAPVLILALPFIAVKAPTLTDLFQSFTLFLAIYYLKTLYLPE